MVYWVPVQQIWCMHGLIPYVVKIVVGSFTTHEQHLIDVLIDIILVSFDPVSNQNIPEQILLMVLLIWNNEWAGVAFAIALIVCCCQGYNMFQKVYSCNLQKQQSSEENDSQNVHSSDDDDNSSHSESRIEIGNDNN